MKRAISLTISLLFGLSVFAQNRSVVQIHSADSTNFLKNKEGEYNRIHVIGNVFIEHEGLLMFSDSAYQQTLGNPPREEIEAFGNVHIVQGDTLHLYCDYLHYDALRKYIKARKNVRLEHAKAALTTDSLDYDLVAGVGYYNKNGKLVDSTNVLTSVVGKYFSQRKEAFFQQDVKIESPDYIIESDSLRYNTETGIAYLIAPTHFTGNEGQKLYTERGTHETQTGISRFTQNTRLENESYVLTGDTLDYDQKEGVGIVRQNCELIDTANNLTITAHYMYGNQRDSSVLVTDSLLLMSIEKSDTLYVHSDTLFVHKDTLGFNIIDAYHRVKIFRTDLQGKCDSLSFTFQDSILRMFHDPIIWAGENQLMADTVLLEFSEEELKYLHLREKSFISSIYDETSKYYNQIKGKTMKGFVVANKLKEMRVYGNGESIYFAEDKGETVGLNRIVSSNIFMELEEQKIEKILFDRKPEGTLYPLSYVDNTKLYLAGFQWNDANRAREKKDVFEWNDAIPIDPASENAGMITEEEEEGKTLPERNTERKSLQPEESRGRRNR